MQNAIHYIRQRKSVRTYSSRSVDPAMLLELSNYIKNLGSGPFGVPARFELLDLEGLDQSELRSLGTYGFIRGANLYLLGAARQGREALVDLGYCFEKLILKVTALGLGTCWLGGTFKRSSFAEKMNLEPEELLPVISPVGHAAAAPGAAEKVVRAGAGSDRRKPWSQLFFYNNEKTPLKPEEAGLYREVLEAVRLAPSASNKQPWRVIKENNNLYHLYLKENIIYNRMLGKIKLQWVDMGIAICHFELAAKELKINGRWHFEQPQRRPSGMTYIISWLA